MTATQDAGGYVVEGHSVDFIPVTERHGRAWHLGPFWFAENQQFLTVITGLLAVVLGLDLFWAVVAIVVGNLLGTVFMAYHSAQGPRLGIPQMIQSRAQFGFYGAAFLFLATFFLQFGFFASTVALSGETLNALSASVSIPLGIMLLAVPMTALAVFGYKLLHYWQQVGTVVFGLTIAVVTWQVADRAVSRGLPSGAWSVTPPSFALFLVVVSIIAVYQISWAPFVSDYSRYLPEQTTIKQAFWWTYAGSAFSCVWLEILGCLVTVLLPTTDTAAAFGAISGRWVLFVFTLSLIGAAATNLYCGMIALVTILNTWKDVRKSVLLRIAGIALTLVVGLAVALAGYRSFLTNFSNFLLVLLFIFVPWTAVNLTDFYLVRHGKYDTASFFTPRGLYGAWGWQGLVAYFVGLGIEIPFIDQTLYTGPFAKALGGADISWILGIVVAAVAYYAICRRWPPRVVGGPLAGALAAPAAAGPPPADGPGERPAGAPG
jgi:nucleobase:cation symporter-1, NCS1 family